MRLNLAKTLSFIVVISAMFYGDAGLARTERSAGGSGLYCSRRDTDPLKCMMCAIASEAQTQTYQGKVEVGRTIKTRMAERGYPKSVCANAYSGAFDGLNGSPKAFKMPYESYRDDVAAAKQALVEGPNGFDHYLNPRIARDFSWYRKCHNKKAVDAHVFCQIGPLTASVIKEENSVRADVRPMAPVQNEIAAVVEGYLGY